MSTTTGTIQTEYGFINANTDGTVSWHFTFDHMNHSLPPFFTIDSRTKMLDKFFDMGEMILAVTKIGAVVQTDNGLGRVVDVIHVSGPTRNRVDVVVALYNGKNFDEGFQRFPCHCVAIAPEDTPVILTNLDGIQAQPSAYTLDYLKSIVNRGYSREVMVRGTVGYSELGMHTRKADRVGIVAFCRPDSDSYAYVLLDDGSVLDGCFHLFESHAFTLS